VRDLSDITPLQADILEIVRERDGATVADVREGLVDRPDLARTTVTTMLSRMEQYGWLTRTRLGREFTYRAAIATTDVQRAHVRTIIRSLFPDDLPSLVSHALREGDWEDEDLARIEALVREYRAIGRAGDGGR